MMQVKGVVEHIVNWLKEYSEKSNTKGFVVGISGGIDSAVTASLCAKTGIPTLCVEMPIHQPKDQVSRSEKQIDKLKKTYSNVSSVRINLTDIFDAFVKEVDHNDTYPEMALVNTRARIRMTTLYYYAGINNYLVAGTGNKVEDFGIGFFTKYGDGGVDISPIADLLKTEVYEVGKEIGVITEILDAAPTDGLWGDDRTDEDQIGASYPELEWAMNYKGDGSELTPRQNEVLGIYTRLNKINQHKMNPIPVCIIPKHLK